VRRLAHRRDLTIAITPDGKTGYVTNNSVDTVTPVNLATGRPGKPIIAGAQVAMVIARNGKTAYALGNGSPCRVTPINLTTGTPGIPIIIGGDPSALAITPDGKTVYIADQDGTVTPIATATNKPGKPTRIGSGTHSYPASPEEIIFMPSGG
jgi:hyaluronoglucosaminidase